MKFFFCFMAVVMQISALMYYGDVICVDQHLDIYDHYMKRYQCTQTSEGDDEYHDINIYCLMDDKNVIQYVCGAYVTSGIDGYQYFLQLRVKKITLFMNDFDVHDKNATKLCGERLGAIGYFNKNIFLNLDGDFTLSHSNAALPDHNEIINQLQVEYFNKNGIIITQLFAEPRN